MGLDLTKLMDAWYKGEISDTDMLHFLLMAQADVIAHMKQAQDRRIANGTIATP